MTLRNIAIISLTSLITSACTQANIAQAEVYQIDASHTHVQFSVDRFGFNDVIATFLEVDGTITLDQDSPENSSVSVDISAASVMSGDASRDEAIVTPFWLNVENFPTMHYQSTSIEMISDTQADITGDLTLLGVIKPVILHATLNKIGEDRAARSMAAGFSATAVLNRSDFEMNTALGMVGDEVTIRIETLAHLIEEDAEE